MSVHHNKVLHVDNKVFGFKRIAYSDKHIEYDDEGNGVQ